MNESNVQSLSGRALAGVGFIQDYVELYFDGPILRCIANPLVAIDSQTVRFPETGSRDTLCELIGRKVVHVSVHSNTAIEIEFSGGATVKIPLDDASQYGGEAAHFITAPGEPLEVW